MTESQGQLVTVRSNDADEREAAWGAYYQLLYLGSTGVSAREFFGGDDD